MRLCNNQGEQLGNQAWTPLLQVHWLGAGAKRLGRHGNKLAFVAVASSLRPVKNWRFTNNLRTPYQDSAVNHNGFWTGPNNIRRHHPFRRTAHRFPYRLGSGCPVSRIFIWSSDCPRSHLKPVPHSVKFHSVWGGSSTATWQPKPPVLQRSHF